MGCSYDEDERLEEEANMNITKLEKMLVELYKQAYECRDKETKRLLLEARKYIAAASARQKTIPDKPIKEWSYNELGLRYECGYDGGLLWRDKLTPTRNLSLKEKKLIKAEGWEYDEEENVWYREEGNSQGR